MMNNIKLYLNCTVPKGFFLRNESTSLLDQSEDVPKVISIGAITTVLACINLLFHFSFCKPNAAASLKSRLLNKKTFSRVLVSIVLVLVTPIIITLLVLALCYKVLCSVIIRRDKYFVGFLDSFDVFWSLDDDATINVIGVVESKSAETFVENLKAKLRNISIANNGVDKIFYRRSEEYGFYYWRRYNYIDVAEYVELLDVPDKEELSVVDLEDVMVQVSNEPLPYENEGLFKIFVTKQRVGNYDEETGEYGFIFVIHHSVGDGVALLEFLCETLADKRENRSKMFSMPEAQKYDSPTALMDMMQKLLDIPLCFVDSILRKPDENGLHGPLLLGEKTFKWTESDENLLLMVKEIKDNVDNLSFSDVLVTALSSGLHNYFTKTMANVPEDVAVIVPVRFPKSSSANHNNLMMKNDFSVTILNVPIKDKSLNDVKYRCDQLRKSADPLFNHYFIRLISVFPKQYLKPLLRSSHATMVFSNMPGPATLTVCGGNALKKLVFFVPHKGNTGLGITALCYGGVLRLAASADRALVPEPEDLSYILDCMVHEIKRLHHQHVRN